MLPAFHREQSRASTARCARGEAAIAALAPDSVIDSTPGCEPGDADRDRALWASTRDGGQGALADVNFEAALGFFGRNLRAAPAARPGSPGAA